MTKSNKLTVAAANVLRRFQAVESEAERLAAAQNGTRIVRAVLDHNGLHAIIQDEHGAVLEIAGGQVAVSVNNGE